MSLGQRPVPGRSTIWMNVGQGPFVLAAGVGVSFFLHFYSPLSFSPLSASLWETARYRLKYCLRGPLNPKQPTNQLDIDCLSVHPCMGLLKFALKYAFKLVDL